MAQTYAGFASETERGLHARSSRRRTRRITRCPGSSCTSRTTGDIAPRLGATYRLTDKTVLRGGWGIYFNPNQMNTFTFLTNNPPLAPRFTYNNDTANPTLTLSQPTGVATTSPRTSRRPTAICRTRGRTSGASTSSTSCGGQRSSRSSTSRPGRRTWIAASSSIRPRPPPGPFRRAGRIPTSAVSE